MATRIWGPHISGLNVGPVHIGGCTEVDSDGNGVPDGLTVMFSTQPLGPSAAIHPVQNGASATLNLGTDARLVGTINNCRDVSGANGAPDTFVFQFTIRAEGEVRIPGVPFAIPLGVQVDAFDIAIVKDPGARQRLVDAQFGLAAAGP